MNKVVLDASALLAVLNEEPGSKEVEKLLSNAVMSTVNLAEVLAVLNNLGIAEKDAEQITEELIKTFIEFDQPSAAITASLRSKTKHLGLSLDQPSRK